MEGVVARRMRSDVVAWGRRAWMATAMIGCGGDFSLDDDLDGECRQTTTWWSDVDGDGWGDGEAVRRCGEEAPGFARNGLDCDDADPMIGAGVRGAGCPEDLLGGTARGLVAGGVERVVVTGVVVADASAADAACRAWGTLDDQDLGGVVVAAEGAVGLGGSWSAWTSARWVGEGGGLAGSWDGAAWTGAWADGGAAWCDGEPDPGVLFTSLNPEDPRHAGAWVAVLADLRAVIFVSGGHACLGGPEPVDALVCERARPDPADLLGRGR